jgi:hypothetical protein
MPTTYKVLGQSNPSATTAELAGLGLTAEEISALSK